MAWPLIAGLAVSALGTGLGVAGSAESNKAANNAANQELALQQQYAKQGQKAFGQSFAQSTPQAVQKQIGQGEQHALADYAAANQNKVPALSLSTGNPQADSAEGAQVQQKIGQQNQAAASLQGYSSSQLAQYIKDLQAQTQLGQIGTFARNQNQYVYPLQLQQAGQSGSTLSGIGSLLSSLGGLGSIYGAVNPTLASGASGGASEMFGGMF